MNKITEYLWIGDQLDATQKPMDEIDRVVTVCQTENHMTDYQCNIQDGQHDYETFEEAVIYVIESIILDNVVLVHRHAGMSRSVAVAVCVLHVIEGLTFNEALWTIEQHRQTKMSDEMKESAERFISQHQESFSP